MLFALPMLWGDSTLKILPPFESRSYVELTLQTLAQFGVKISWLDDFTLHIAGNQSYSPCDTAIEGDYSQLAFFAVLGAINSPLTTMGVQPNSAQGDRKIIDIIRAMGGNVVEIEGGYRFAPAPLNAQDIDLGDCPDLGPILTVLASRATGTTRLYNAGRLRIKESDRIADVEAELARFGIDSRSTEDELFITGLDSPPAAAAPCLAHNDHRIVMALAVLATVCRTPVLIQEAHAVNKSYPRFFEDLQNLGVRVEFFDE